MFIPKHIFKVNSFIHFILPFYMIMIRLLSGVPEAYVTYVYVHFTRDTIKRQFHPFTAKTGINQSACRPLFALLAKGITLLLIDIHRTGRREEGPGEDSTSTRSQCIRCNKKIRIKIFVLRYWRRPLLYSNYIKFPDVKGVTMLKYRICKTDKRQG